MLTPEIRAELADLRGFRFRQHPKIDAPQSRLDLLSDIAERQIERVLME